MFNLRDISKVFQGVLQCSTETANSVEKMYRVWVHEVERIFGDRLIDDEDRNWFYENISKISKRFGEGIDVEKIKNDGMGLIFSSIIARESGDSIYE